MGVDSTPPELDRRTQVWLSFFNQCSGNRGYVEGVPLPIRPLDVLEMADRLEFPGQTREILAVVGALDGAWLDESTKKR